MDAISATVASASTAPPPVSNPSSTSLDKDAFLKLLVAQLKYQDPTAPTDVSQMMSQTSQLSMVERLDEIAVGIERLGGSTPISNAASMLGKQITFDIGALSPVTAVVEAVRLLDGDVILSAGGHDIPVGSLLEVRDLGLSNTPTAPPSTAPPSGDGSTGSTGTTETTTTDDDGSDDGIYDTPDY